MKILLLDGYNLIYRARSGFLKGEYPVIYNFFRSLRPIVEKFSPDKIYFVLEGKPEHRMTISESYKSNRKPQSKDFHEQKATIINIIKTYFPIETVLHTKFECDDVIATLSHIHYKMGDSCTIVSSDSDFIQLHNIMEDRFKIYNPIKKKYIDHPGFDYISWKALRGDPSDNILGIPGIGDKKALKLISNPDELRRLFQNKEKLKIFERNVNLIRLVNIEESELTRFKSFSDWGGLRDVFKEMGFFSMIDEKPWNKYINTFNCINNNI